ncbi:homocysteine S-methyltransferase [Spiractinospora alimapuensis]|uniref:homocysteine S-methyltransferase n=1 Tax=Spiractinospora alimapuensis TaxID=2820884 RepID=UPI001EEA4A35|nr:homocysteine S-methyltransferase [Spiractinospora alimapuensis]QVQ52564.1 homocysteine S-methyltransferase [Spiractinospora alimapuensis]
MATTAPHTTILDGGLATHLETLGADLNDELWSARLLTTDPDLIRRTHRDYFRAGAHVAITASYQATPHNLRTHTTDPPEHLLRLSVDLARQARDDHGSGLVAASIGPYGAALADGSEYTGDYGLDTDELTRWHHDRWQILADTPADLLACETIPSYPEALALARLMDTTPERPTWISFSCRDDTHINDGTSIATAVTAFARFADQPTLRAVGVNCTDPHHVPNLVKHITRVLPTTPVVVYPNSGETWAPRTRTWHGTAEPERFAAAAGEWRRLGATHIGGCCRTTPEHIRALRERLTR